MDTILKIFNSSIGRKTVMALSGLFLCIFLLEHLYTNLHLFFGDGGLAFNEASHTMVHSILIRVVEIVLFLAIIVHVGQAINLTGLNNSARPIKYQVSGVAETSNWFSRNMLFTGSLILFFIVVHLYNFFVPYRITHTVGGPEQDTVAVLVVEALGNPLYAGLYLASVILMAMHLNHGFQSAFQTLGLNNKKYAPLLKMAGTGFALLNGVGFAAFPVLFYISKIAGWNLLYWNLN